jgi:hypothetical protein
MPEEVINEGIDLTTKLGTQERQIVRKADIAGHEVTVYHQLEKQMFTLMV